MRISNFQMVNQYGPYMMATVDVRDWMTLWLIKRRRTVWCSKHAPFWSFADRGEFTPGMVVERLYQDWVYKNTRLK